MRFWCVQENAGQLGVRLAKRSNKLLLVGQVLTVDHQYQHDVVSGISAANYAMTERPFAAILLVGVNVELTGKIGHVVEDSASSTVLYQAFL